MRKTVRFLLALLVAFVLMLAFRATALTVYTVQGLGLEPELHRGDHVVVNRWSYGLRVGGGGGIFPYGRLGRRPIGKGDLVAFENPQADGEIIICRCKGLPGDTIEHQGQLFVVPGVVNCAEADHYWMETIGFRNKLDSRHLGFISEKLVIGRATMVLFNYDATRGGWHGWNPARLLLKL